jgi:hypothetical protein
MMTPNTTFIFGTKSETLNQLKPLLKQSKILPIFYFSENDWQLSPSSVLSALYDFAPKGELIIRSSAKNEDGHESSMAGAFLSCLNVSVENEAELITAIEQVIESFSEFSQKDNQVLVQPMLKDINMSGVVMTHDLERGAPYYVINYDDESGLTDTITGGVGIQKTVLIYREVEQDKIYSKRIRTLLTACYELEELCGKVPLDIEFAIDHSGIVYIFQVRRITLFTTWHPITERRVARTLGHVSAFISQVMKPKKGIYGEKTILGVMPDWNPAEIIGTTPRPLASSLYRYLITQSVWRKSRAEMGYFEPENEELMVMIDHHPYIDVRNSFNSFLPNNLDVKIKDKLVNAWIVKLQSSPELHDKVEFEIVQTCLDFTFEKDFSQRFAGALTACELAEYRASLYALSNQALLMQEQGSLIQASNTINRLATEQALRTNHEFASLSQVQDLLISCREQGTHAFSILARHAFIAETILRSAVNRSAISVERLQLFKQSIHTITTDLASEYGKVCNGEERAVVFLQKFGHLRPGTYDITSLRYDERNDLFTGQVPLSPLNSNEEFTLTSKETEHLQILLEEAGFAISPEQLLTYMCKAITGREYAKFVFTRDLSDALNVLTQWGARVGLSRDDLSYLDISLLLDTLTNPLLDDLDRALLHYVETAKRDNEQARALKLGHLICSPDDIFVIPLHRSMANFITNKIVESELVVLHLGTPATTELRNKIVCIENADPGYDWLFTKGIAGLMTQYGGTNSHMAIRCSEFAIPAAIGCGEQLFSRLIKSKKLVLNCRDKKVELLS